jgi:hypothetical protein
VADLAETVAGLERDWWPISPKSARISAVTQKKMLGLWLEEAILEKIASEQKKK